MSDYTEIYNVTAGKEAKIHCQVIQKISSIQNKRIKEVLQLQKASERKKQRLFIIEGQREIFMALQAGIRLVVLFYCEEILGGLDKNYFFDVTNTGAELIHITRQVFEKIAYRENSSGLLAIAQIPPHDIHRLNISEPALIVVLEGLEKPGNIGAILRTADAAAVDAVLICNPAADLYNPNTIRSSVGCVFTNQIAVCSHIEALNFLRQKKIQIITTDLRAGRYYHQVDYTDAVAFVLGAEAQGVSAFWKEYADERIKIPMRGKIDSINVATAAALLMYEAQRQRGFPESLSALSDSFL